MRSFDFNTSIDAYHRDERLSCSKLKTFAQVGAYGFHARHIARTSPPEVDSDALIFGQIFEDICQGRGFNANGKLVVKPAGMIFNTKDNRAWRDEHLAAGRSIVTEAEIDSAMAMRAALETNETAVEMIRSSLMQATLRSDFEGTPGLQSRPDYISAEGCLASGYAPMTVDLKSCRSLADLSVGRCPGISSLRYDAQAAIVRECWGIRGSRHYLLACEKTYPYRCQVVEVTDAWLDVGWRWSYRQLTRLARHYASGLWPRVDAELVTLPAPPAWADADSDDELSDAAE